MEDLTGKQLGPYQVVASLGEGGMAAVYKAYHASMERYVALKILPRHLAEDPQFVGRFKQEAKVLANLQHPHILPVFDFGEADHYTYLVMPLIQGGTLAKTLTGRPSPLKKILKVISQMSSALSYAHTRGLVHRDIKPSNILVDESGNFLLTDFGIAKIVESTKKFTTTGGIVGTPAYMSPEQGRGDKIDSRSDIYSLGVILYEMATGRVPYDAETPIAVIFKHIQDPLPLPRAVNPDLPEAVERVLLKVLSKNREDRYATSDAMVQALEKAIINEGTLTADATLRGTLDIPTLTGQEEQTLLGREEEERLAQEKAEQERLAIEKAEAERLAKEKIEAERIAKETAEAERIAKEKTEQERLAREKAEAERIAKERAEQERVVSPQTIRSDRKVGTQTLLFGMGAMGFIVIGVVVTVLGIIYFALRSQGGAAAPPPIVITYTPLPPTTMPTIARATATHTPQPSNTPTARPSNTSTSTFGIGSTQVSKIDGMTMLYVPAGSFTMGSDSGQNDEKPVHTVTLKAFWIDRFEVINVMYTFCVKAGACSAPRETKSSTRARYYGTTQYNNYPVIYVSWNDAIAYCKWAGRRLPTEAEWEKAARGTDGRTYPWGNAAPDQNKLNYNNNVGDTTEVGKYPSGASIYGALDMAGNVWEWVSSQARAYPYSATDGREDLAVAASRAARGGSWNYNEGGVRVSNRVWGSPTDINEFVGFRCASSP